MEVRDVIPFSFVGREISNSVRIAGVYNIVLSYKIERIVHVSCSTSWNLRWIVSAETEGE